MTNDEYYQEPGPRDGKMLSIAESLTIPQKIGPVDCTCQDCGNIYQGDLYKWPKKVPKPNYPGAFNTIWQEKILGGTRCPACAEKKAEEDRKAEAVAREAAFATRRCEVRQNCGIGERYQKEDFSTFKLEGLSPGLVKAYRQAFNYAEKFPIVEMGKGYPSMVLFSESSWGVGKTHLAGAIAHRILDRWAGQPAMCPITFISEPEFLLKITATYNYSTEERQYRESEADIINRLLYVPLLIIDDIGKRKVADLRFVQRIHYSIIDGRYKRLKPVVLTANLDSESLGRYLGGVNPAGDNIDGADEATLDRLIEMCQGKFIKMDGKSYRRNKPGQARERGS